MVLLDHLAIGFSQAFTLGNLLYAFFGCLIGTAIGVLPGIGPSATIAILLPFTFGLEALPALIMLAGIFYGAQYGGSTTAILVNLPGETSSIMTLLDGHAMAKQGRAGVALSAAAIASFFAGCVGTLLLAAFAQPLTALAITFGPAEYFSLMAVCLVGAVALTSDDLTKALCMIITGILLGLVGSDVNSGALRFTFGISELWDGLDFVALAVALFALTDIIANLEDPEQREDLGARLTSLWPTAADRARMWAPMVRGTGLGSVMGVLPGAGASVASFLSYSIEKRLGKHRDQFGKGAIEGVAGPEAANNAAAQTAFIPTLALGIPGGASMALFLGALTLHNIQPGPRVISEKPELFWGLVASMWIGNLMLVVLNLPLVGLWAQILRVPYKALFPAILMFCCIGVYSVQNSTFSVLVLCALGALGYLFSKLACEPAPLALGFVLGPMLEEHFRRALAISHGDFSIFVTRPLSAAFLLLAVLLLVVWGLAMLRSRSRSGRISS